ncbi:MAG: pyridoxal-phosphate-dependent aminotransferase family protein [Polyangiaceae bacterium]
MAESAPKQPRKKLFIPGPVEVYPEILAEMARPMIGHRSEAFRALYKEVIEGLRWFFSMNRAGDTPAAPRQHVFTSTASATGVWEGASRCCVKKGVLHLVNGAFSERWEEVSRLNGRATGVYAVEWGKAHRAAEVEKHLASGKYDAVAIVHSETSTGVLDPLAEICAVAKKFDGVQVLVDAVSSLTTVPIDVDALGIDVCLASVQKGFALPPGLTVFTVSERALERTKTVADRGYYFAFDAIAQSAAKDETPSTPAISQLFALRKQIERMKAETLERRFARHRDMAMRVRGWAAERGFQLFPEAGFETFGLTCIANTRSIDVKAMAAHAGEKGFALDQGYGKLKGKTFRIAHMGDVTPTEVEELLAALDGFLAKS